MVTYSLEGGHFCPEDGRRMFLQTIGHHSSCCMVVSQLSQPRN